MQETRKHKEHYFPIPKKYQAKRSTNDAENGSTISNTTTYNTENPVNFLFSNENDFDDDDDDENDT